MFGLALVALGLSLGGCGSRQAQAPSEPVAPPEVVRPGPEAPAEEGQAESPPSEPIGPEESAAVPVPGQEPDQDQQGEGEGRPPEEEPTPPTLPAPVAVPVPVPPCAQCHTADAPPPPQEEVSYCMTCHLNTHIRYTGELAVNRPAPPMPHSESGEWDVGVCYTCHSPPHKHLDTPHPISVEMPHSRFCLACHLPLSEGLPIP